MAKCMTVSEIQSYKVPTGFRSETLKLLIFGSLFLLSSCSHYQPKTAFVTALTPVAPDYSQESAWAALPMRKDLADSIAYAELRDLQASSKADVFYLHPTTYTYGFRNARLWNAPVDNVKLNEKTDGSAILYQSSIFNGTGRIFAPRYRQAHYHSYFAKDKESAAASFKVAYSDVRAAFEYYLKYYNNGRPFIIAGHSQGTNHAEALIKEFIDGKPLQKQLIAAYLIGMPIAKNTFQQIPPCQSPEETGCFCSWRTFQRGYDPPGFLNNTDLAVTNPLTWRTDFLYAPDTLNQGAILRNFTKVMPKLCDAQVHEGILWTTKPKFPGSFLFTSKNFHIADMNFYYLNIRQNAELRAAHYFSVEH